MYLSERVATIMSVRAEGETWREMISDRQTSRKDPTDLVVLRDDVGEGSGADLGVVAALLHRDAKDLAGLDESGGVGSVHLRSGQSARAKYCNDERRTLRTQYFPPFFFLRISRASGSYPGAMIPSETSREMILAVATSQVCESAMKSPKEDMRSAPEEEM